ncbi:LYR motif-containing protein 4 isoform X1 [Hyla sarda]|uniref:LYR motif-containing protein 4 isoform X1 n=1 Tax=Hyla sarda TaxID=327740 RepID=UPI0024C40976|nr:LYR motif-containing protein 4 isoform X1 [Hyla sarda]
MLYFYKQMSLRYELRQDNHLPEYQYIIHQGKSIDQGYLCSASTLCLRQTVQEKGSAAQSEVDFFDQMDWIETLTDKERLAKRFFTTWTVSSWHHSKVSILVTSR